ncbi:hypothetical protein BHU24_22160 [Bacillus pseudomycoides]|nr:hypothetical protein [Bacillus pseudomycoides]PDZ13431.1 hypothetical protein CON70_01545 [Bacillus pseudomycoides]PEO83576.1 hypothetical protein CN571_24785 [Bacillus pseudomycoides]
MKRIVTESPDNKGKSYSWNPAWIQPLESPFSIFQKFMFANVFPLSKLYGVFGSCLFRVRKIPVINKKFGSLSSLEGFDRETIHNILKIDLKYIEITTLKQFHNDNANLWKSDKYHLKYCQECLKQGYHSLLHQLVYIDYCFIHNTPLKNTCPSCTVVFIYNLKELRFSGPFKCECGHFFLYSDSYRKFPLYWMRKYDMLNTPLVQMLHSLNKEDLKRCEQILHNYG